MTTFVKVEREEEYCELCGSSYRWPDGELMEFVQIDGREEFICTDCVEAAHDALNG